MQFNKTYGGIGNDYASVVVQTSDGDYVIAGSTDSFGTGSQDLWLIKTDSEGNMKWNSTFGGASYDYASSVVQTRDGGYALAGYTESFGAGSADAWLVKTDSDGEMVWTQTFGGKGYDEAYSVVQTSDEGYALAGATTSFGAGFLDFWLVKTESYGNMQWNNTFGGEGDDEAYSVVQTSDNGYTIAGYTNSTGKGGYDVWLVKTDSAGKVQWTQTHGETGSDYAYFMRQTSDEGYLLAGSTDSSGAGGFDFWLVKTDDLGNIQWNSTYGGTAYDGAYSAVETNDGKHIVAGSTSSFGAGNADFWLVKTESPLSSPTPSSATPPSHAPSPPTPAEIIIIAAALLTVLSAFIAVTIILKRKRKNAERPLT
jgi:predicted secreted protein